MGYSLPRLSGQNPGVALIFPLAPTRAGTIRLWDVAARRSVGPVACRAGSSVCGIAERGIGTEADRGGAARRDRSAEGSQGPSVNQTKRNGGRDRAEAWWQAGQTPSPRQGDAAGRARDRGAARGASCGFAVQRLRAVPSAGVGADRACGALPPRALADAGWRDDRGAAARRHPRPFWTRATPL